MKPEDTPEFLPLPAGFRMSDERKRLADFEATLRTFDEWSKAGYTVIKGSKHVARNGQGVCLFSGAQVTEYEIHDPALYEDEDYEFDPDLPGNPDDYGHSD